jgi:hypothetical protein
MANSNIIKVLMSFDPVNAVIIVYCKFHAIWDTLVEFTFSLLFLTFKDQSGGQ